jgi:hypothetical protein
MAEAQRHLLRSSRWPLHAAVAVAIAAIGFLVGRASVADGVLSTARESDAPVARFDGGTLGADALREPLANVPDPRHRREAVEQLVRIRLLALRGEEAGLHRTPEFVGRYAEELARAYVEKAFEEPFKKKLPTEDEVRAFFDENRAKLGRPRRLRVGHVAFLAPAADAAAREQKRRAAEKALGDARRRAGDDYAFGEIALTRSEDPRSRGVAGELPFLTREEIAARLGAAAADAAEATAPGRLVGRVVETAQGFQVLKVLAVEDPHDAAYDELRDAIRARLTADRREKAFDEFAGAIWKGADVRIDEKALERLAPEKQRKTSR